MGKKPINYHLAQASRATKTPDSKDLSNDRKGHWLNSSGDRQIIDVKSIIAIPATRLTGTMFTPLSLSPVDARQLVRRIVNDGYVNYDIPHFKDRMQKRTLSILDVNNALRAGTHSGPEGMDLRFTAATQRVVVVYAFENEEEITLITAWKPER